MKDTISDRLQQLFLPMDGSRAMTGQLILSGDPAEDRDAARKAYVDAQREAAIANALSMDNALAMPGSILDGRYMPRDEFPMNFVVAAANSHARSDAHYFCDGIADEDEINAAIVAAGPAGRVVLLEGTYVLGNSIVLASDLTLSGLGKGTIIDGSGLGVQEAIIEYIGTDIEDVTIEKMKLTGPSTDYPAGHPSTGAAVYIATTSHNKRFVARDLFIERCQHGVYLLCSNAGLESFRIENNDIESCSRAGIFVCGGSNGKINQNNVDGDRTGVGDGVTGDICIWLTEGHPPKETGYISVSKNRVSNADIEVINISARRCIVTQNIVTGTALAGISVETSGSPPVAGCGCYNVVSNNDIFDVGTGITIRNDPANNTVAGNYNVLESNVIVGTTAYGIMVVGNGADPADDPEGNIISNNVIRPASGHGITIKNSYETEVSNNNIGGGDIYVYGAGASTCISGGIIANAPGIGMAIGGSSDGITIQSVDVVNPTGHGISVGGTVDNIIIENCTFVDNQGVPTMTNGVFLGAIPGTATVRNNSCRNATGYNFDLSRAGTVIAYGNLVDNEEPVIGFAGGDTTPSVKVGRYFRIGGAVIITTFNDGYEGKVIKVINKNAAVTIDFTGTNLKGNNGADWLPAVNDHMTCFFDGTTWYCDVSDN